MEKTLIQVPLRRVILESPFAGANEAEIETNRSYLIECLRDSLARGEAPFASHGLYPGALYDHVPEQRQLGIAAGYAWWAGADYVVFYMDRGLSRGMEQALQKCRRESITHSFRSLHGAAELENAMAKITGSGEESSLKIAVEYLTESKEPKKIQELDNESIGKEKWNDRERYKLEGQP